MVPTVAREPFADQAATSAPVGSRRFADLSQFAVPTRSGQSALQIGVLKVAFADELVTGRSHADSSSHGFNSATRASL